MSFVQSSRRIPTQAEDDQATAQFEAANADQQRKARIRRGIDWNICLVPGCGRRLYSVYEGNVPAEDRDPNVWLPMCHLHAAVVWRNVNRIWQAPQMREELEQAQERRREQTAERERQRRESEGPGSIYILRQNGLIKVGWAGHLGARLKNYGPNVELLCHFAGSRDDETRLHRQLRPSLARGREWYHDDDVLAMFVERAIAEHGPPTATASWTKPKQNPVRIRRTR